MHHGPSNIQTLHHHPFESYRLMMDNIPGDGILPPGLQPSTSLAAPSYPQHPYNQSPPQQQHYIFGHGGCNRESERDQESDRKFTVGQRYLTRATSFLQDLYHPHALRRLFEGINSYTSLTRARFEELCQNLFQSALNPAG